MRRTYLLLAVAAAFAWTPQASHAQVQTKRGATMGGLAGAVVGGLIGSKNHNAGAGAAIGGVVGAVSGGLLGNAADKQNAIDQQRYAYAQQQQQQRNFQATQSAVSVADVVSMSRSGLAKSVIVNQIQQRGVQQKLQVADIIALHQQGVSENVITSMQRAPTGVQQIARPPQAVVRQEHLIHPAPVIVEETYVLPHYAPRRHYYRYARPHQYDSHHYNSHSGIRISF